MLHHSINISSTNTSRCQTVRRINLIGFYFELLLSLRYISVHLCHIHTYICLCISLSFCLAAGPSRMWERLRGARGGVRLWLAGGEYASGPHSHPSSSSADGRHHLSLSDEGQGVRELIMLLLSFSLCFLRLCGCRNAPAVEAPAAKSAH